jgi:predicted RNase H-like HicB family nuclease
MTTSVDVTYHVEPDGTWWADSPDVPGFVAGGETLAEVRQLVFEGIPFYLDTQDVDIREAQEGSARLDLTFEMRVADWAPTSWATLPAPGTSNSSYLVSNPPHLELVS